MEQQRREKYERALLILARAVSVGFAYVLAAPIPGLTSSFVAIFMSLIPFDLMVAAPRPLLSVNEGKQLVTVVRPRLRSTAVTLLKGVTVGIGLGALTLLGFPETMGRALTAGLAYVWATRTPHLISSYVAIMSGLSLYEGIQGLLHAEIPPELAGLETPLALGGAALWTIARDTLFSAAGTFLGMAIGWAVGGAVGSVTRLFLSRPYRSLQSQAYEQPITKKPFDQVLHIGEQNVLVTTVVETGAPLAYRSLAEARLRQEFRATVLQVQRADEEVAMPPGSFVLLPGDELLVLVVREMLEELRSQLQAPASAAPPSDAPPTDAPPTDAPSTNVLPTDAPATGAPPTYAPATGTSPTDAPATDTRRLPRAT